MWPIPHPFVYSGTAEWCKQPGFYPDRAGPEDRGGIPGTDAGSNLTLVAGCDEVVSRPATYIFRGYDCPACFAEMGRHFR